MVWPQQTGEQSQYREGMVCALTSAFLLVFGCINGQKQRAFDVRERPLASYLPPTSLRKRMKDSMFSHSDQAMGGARGRETNPGMVYLVIEVLDLLVCQSGVLALRKLLRTLPPQIK